MTTATIKSSETIGHDGPRVQPDIIEPQSPPEKPVSPTPIEEPHHQPTEVPGNPGGNDIDEPGRGPQELPPQQL